MDKYEVRISSAAQRDFLGLAEQLDALPPEEAAQQFEQLLDDTKVLQSAPASCPYARDLQLRLRGYRILAIDDYLFFFVLHNKTVDIRRILYAKRQYDRLV